MFSLGVVFRYRDPQIQVTENYLEQITAVLCLC